MKFSLLSILVAICLVGCADSKVPNHPIQTEVGKMPAEITWNNHEYRVTSEQVTTIGEKLGTAVASDNSTRPVYRILNSDPTKEIAIEQRNIFFRVVAK